MGKPIKAKRPTKAAPVARVPKGKKHLSGTIATGDRLAVRIIDCRTGFPVVGAAALTVEVSGLVAQSPPTVDTAADRSDLPRLPRFEGAYLAKHEKALTAAKKAVADAEAALEKETQDISALVEAQGKAQQARSTYAQELYAAWAKQKKAGAVRGKWSRYRESDPKYKELKQAAQKASKALATQQSTVHAYWDGQKKIDELVRHRKARQQWVTDIKRLLTIHGTWSEAVDGAEDPAVMGRMKTAVRVALGWKSAPKRQDRWGPLLHDRLAKRYVTDKEGILRIPLPVASTGTVTLEMAHFKLLPPAETDAFFPIGGILGDRMVDYLADEVTSSPPTDGDTPTDGDRPTRSNWQLRLDGNEKPPDPARFLNRIEMDYDTTAEESEAVLSVAALVWCQPVWNPVKARDYDPGPEHHPEVGHNTGGSLVDGRPTMLISTTAWGSAEGYGQYGHARTESGLPDFYQRVRRIEGRWYSIEPLSPPAEVWSGDSMWEAALWIQEHCSDPGLRESLAICSFFGELSWRVSGGMRLLIGLPEPDHRLSLPELHPPRNEPSLVEKGVRIVQVFEPTAQPSREAAVVAAANKHLSGKRSIAILPMEDGKKTRFEVRWHKAEGKTGLYSARVDTLEQAVALIAHRMHMGVDVAGHVEDPVFASVGGEVRNRPEHYGSVSGYKVAIAPWTTAEVHWVSMAHNITTLCSKGMVVKAGDRVSLMGRTGNPSKASPTHVHFGATGVGGMLDFRMPLVSGEESVLPWNGIPRLLPCAGEYGTDANPQVPGRQSANACGRYTGSKSDKVHTTCWAYVKGTCPNPDP